MELISVKPENILLLEADFGEGKYHNGIGLEYVDKDNMKEFINEDVYDYGDFCWFDYKDIDILNKMTELQLAESLYLRHKFNPLYNAHMDWLDNDYLYMAHDDDYWTKIFMKNVDDYKNVIHGIILKALKGRKRHIEPLPDKINDYIFTNYKMEFSLTLKMPILVRKEQLLCSLNSERIIIMMKYMKCIKEREDLEVHICI